MDNEKALQLSIDELNELLDKLIAESAPKGADFDIDKNNHIPSQAEAEEYMEWAADLGR